ncbi:MAG: TonB-dependent receptor [Tannerella sp.]|jgi:TonB-linked SusC/RagA family outer membrane protein|nr:TonB-dependent receptor [Tannerella sp.]
MKIKSLKIKRNMFVIMLLCIGCALVMPSMATRENKEWNTQTVQQQLQVTGVVKDEFGDIVSGANVIEKGTTNGIITDMEGRFTLSVKPNAILLISYMGFLTQEVKASNNMTVILEEDTRTLEEVVVVGYGVQRKSDVTGAMVSVSEKQLKERPVTNAMEALQGKAAGVDIINDARPGELGTIRIRGQRSITGSSDPLYVVDGIPIQGRENINVLNTYDIKSIEILKDASATAIYGSRGANGVILITTHGGEEGRFSVSYNGSTSFETFQDSQEHFNSAEWIDFRRWAYYYYDPVNYPRGDQPTEATDRNIFGGEIYAWRNVQKGWESGTWDGSRVETTDWAKYVSQTGITHNHTINVSGGTQKMKAYASIGYLNQKGTTIGQGYRRYTANVNTKIKPIDWFEIGLQLNGSFSEQDYGQDGTGGGSASSASLYISSQRLYPYAVPYDDEGNRILNPGGDTQLRTVVDEVNYSHNLRQVINIRTNTFAQVKLPLDGLTYRVEFGPSFRIRRNGIFVDPNSAIRENAVSLVRLINQRDFSWTVNNLIYYNKSFDIHTVGLTLLQTASRNEQAGDHIYGQNAPVGDALWNDLGAIDRTKDILELGSSISREQLSSYMIRMNYSLKDRYMLTTSGRWDGSSVLAPGHKWAFFPSVALAWRMEQEDFLKSVSWIGQLKFRVGYGITGNAAVNRYVTINDLNSGLYPYGDQLTRFYYINDLLQTGTSEDNVQSLANENLRWEKTAQYNIGVDFSIIKNRISGVIDGYVSNTTDLLLTATIPSLTGYTRTTANLGATRNHGVDITLNTINMKVGNFTWETSVNVGWQKNKIVELSSGKNDEISASDVTASRIIGQPIGVYYDYKVQGIWKEEDKAEMDIFNSDKYPDGTPKAIKHDFKVGQIRPVDQNGDYMIDANNDRTIIGQTNPSWSGGITNIFSWKGIELLMQMYGRLGYWTNGANVVAGGRYMIRKVDYYTDINTNATYQRPEYTSDGSDRDQYNTILAYSKASFLNIRNISLGYVFPKKTIQKWSGMQSLRIYFQCVNPGAVYQSVKWKNMDLNSPIWTRNFVFGLNVGF